MTGFVDDPTRVKAEALIDLGRPEEAISLVGAGLMARPDDQGLLAVLGRAQLEIDPEAALKTAARLAQVSAHNYQAPMLAATASRRLRRRHEATVYARQAIALAPHNPNAYAELAAARTGTLLGYTAARAAAQKAIDLAPTSPVGYIAAGNVRLGVRLARRADRWYRRALELDPNCRAAQHNRVVVKRARGRLNQAFADVQAMLAVDPRDARAHRLLDTTIERTLLHLQWIVLVGLLVAIELKG